MYEIGSTIIASFVWMIGFVFFTIMLLVLFGFTTAMIRAIYNYADPGKKGEE